MKNYFSKILIAVAVFTFVLFANDVANAQTGPRKARGKVYTKADVEKVIKRVEERMDFFKEAFDKALDKSKLDGSNREDELNAKAKKLEGATDELRSEFDKRDAWIENKDQVRKCLNLATDLDVAMRNRKLGGAAESSWAKLRYEFNTLAKIYNLPMVGANAYK